MAELILTEEQKKREEKRQQALTSLHNVPDDFWWSIKGEPFKVSSLIKIIEALYLPTESQSEFVIMVLAIGGKPSVAEEIYLGKKYHCLKSLSRFRRAISLILF
jgi:hypothetical protein